MSLADGRDTNDFSTVRESMSAIILMRPSVTLESPIYVRQNDMTQKQIRVAFESNYSSLLDRHEMELRCFCMQMVKPPSTRC